MLHQRSLVGSRWTNQDRPTLAPSRPSTRPSIHAYKKDSLPAASDWSSPASPRALGGHAGHGRRTDAPGRGTRARAGSGQALPSDDEQRVMFMAAARALQALCEALPDVPHQRVAAMAKGVPSIVQEPADQVASKLSNISQLLGAPLPQVVALVAAVPPAWNRSPEAVAAKLQPLASQLGVGLGQALGLILSQPAMWGTTNVALIRDRLEALAKPLGVELPVMVDLVARQSRLYYVDPSQVRCSLPRLMERLGLPQDLALQLVADIPPVIALEPRLLQLNLAGLSTMLGMPLPPLVSLVSECTALALLAVPPDLLALHVEYVSQLGVGVEAMVELLQRQPTLLCTGAPTISSALDVVSDTLAVSRGRALGLLLQQPALLYDYGRDVIQQRLTQLAATFETTPDEIRTLAARQPALLVISASTFKACLASLGGKLGRSRGEVLQLMVTDPGWAVMFGYMDSIIDSWSVRLGLDPPVVSRLVCEQPALLEITPNTVKARLESLSALFAIPLELAVMLVMKHPALGAIPPNATISRAKNMSMALGISLGMAGELMAKQPAVLCMGSINPGELNRELKPYVESIVEVVAVYEYVTRDWLERQAKQAPKPKSFATIHNVK